MNFSVRPYLAGRVVGLGSLDGVRRLRRTGYSDEFSAAFRCRPAWGPNALVLDENGLVDGGCGLGYPLGTGRRRGG